MSDPAPPHPLHRLLEAQSPEDRDAAWTAFLERHSKLILHTARRVSSGHDDAMDRYTHVLDRLREDDFKRLRTFSLNGTGKFTTWLVVVVRRLCIDHRRQVVGRPQGEKDRTADLEFIARRNLAEFMTDDLDLDQIPEETSRGPDADLILKERAEQLAAALAELTRKERLLLTLRYVDDYSRQTRAYAFGFHVKCYQIQRFAADMDQNTFLRALSDSGWSLIYLRRADVVAHAFSGEFARHAGRFHFYQTDRRDGHERLQVDADGFVRRVQRRLQWQEIERQALNGLAHFSLTYEDDLLVPEIRSERLQALLDWLSIPCAELTTEMVRSVRGSPWELMTNPNEVKSALEDSGLGSIL